MADSNLAETVVHEPKENDETDTLLGDKTDLVGSDRSKTGEEITVTIEQAEAEMRARAEQVPVGSTELASEPSKVVIPEIRTTPNSQPEVPPATTTTADFDPDLGETHLGDDDVSTQIEKDNSEKQTVQIPEIPKITVNPQSEIPDSQDADTEIEPVSAEIEERIPNEQEVTYRKEYQDGVVVTNWIVVGLDNGFYRLLDKSSAEKPNENTGTRILSVPKEELEKANAQLVKKTDQPSAAQ